MKSQLNINFKITYALIAQDDAGAKIYINQFNTI